MASMTGPEIEGFLAAPRHAVLATNGPSGAPQLTPVWFLYDGGQLWVSAGANTAKVRNLRRDPHITLCIDGGHPDARYVVITGRARLVEPNEPLQQEIRWRIIRHYHNSEEDARAYYEEVRGTPAVLIVIEPETVLSQNLN